jgi:hypothetical protein
MDKTTERLLATRAGVYTILNLPRNALFGAASTAFSWTVPAGVTQIAILCIGGGGSGAGWTSVNKAPNISGSGGGGGALAYVNQVSVTPGEILTIVAGMGGLGVNGGNSGKNGNG